MILIFLKQPGLLVFFSFYDLVYDFFFLERVVEMVRDISLFEWWFFYSEILEEQGRNYSLKKLAVLLYFCA